MGISDKSYMIDGLPLLDWRWNLGKSGQGRDLKIAYDFRRDLRTAQLCTSKNTLPMNSFLAKAISQGNKAMKMLAQLCSCRQKINR